MAGLLAPDRGRITLGDSTWFDSEAGVDVAPEDRRCGYLFQDYALFPNMNAWRNVAFGLRETPRAEREPRARELLGAFGVGELAEAPPRELSGGERQRVALARALASQPRLILLDEPLAALDARTAASASRELASALSQSEVPAMLVTHDFAEAALLADEVAVIDRGRVIQRGPAGELSSRPASAFVADFAGASVMFGVTASGDGSTTSVNLDGGGTIASSDRASGPVGVAVYPWEITLEPPGLDVHGSALNRIEATVTSVTEVGNRARIGLLAAQPLAAEVTTESVARLALAPGVRVAATFKATATRLVAR